jgi:hypothetical protein
MGGGKEREEQEKGSFHIAQFWGGREGGREGAWEGGREARSVRARARAKKEGNFVRDTDTA